MASNQVRVEVSSVEHRQLTGKAWYNHQMASEMRLASVVRYLGVWRHINFNVTRGRDYIHTPIRTYMDRLSEILCGFLSNHCACSLLHFPVGNKNSSGSWTNVNTNDADNIVRW